MRYYFRKKPRRMGRRFYLSGMLIAVAVGAIFGYQQGRSIDLFSDPFATDAASQEDSAVEPSKEQQAAQVESIPMIRGMTPVPPAPAFPEEENKLLSIDEAEAQTANAAVSPRETETLPSIPESETIASAKVPDQAENTLSNDSGKSGQEVKLPLEEPSSKEERITNLTIRPLDDGQGTAKPNQPQDNVANLGTESSDKPKNDKAVTSVAADSKPKPVSSTPETVAKVTPIKVEPAKKEANNSVDEVPETSVNESRVATKNTQLKVGETTKTDDKKKPESEISVVKHAEKADKAAPAPKEERPTLVKDTSEEKGKELTAQKIPTPDRPEAKQASSVDWVDVTGKQENLARAEESGWVDVSPEKGHQVWRDVTRPGKAPASPEAQSESGVFGF